MSNSREAFLRQYKLVKELDAELKKAKKKLTSLQEMRLAEMSEQGILSEKLESGETLYTHTDLRVGKRGGIPTHEVVAALKAVGYGEICSESYAAASLGGIVRDLIKNEEEVPPRLANLLNTYEDVSLRLRKS